MHAITLLEWAADQQVEVDIDPPFLELSDEVIFPVQLFRIQGSRVIRAVGNQTSRSLEIKELKPDTVYSETCQGRGPERSIPLRWDLPRTLTPVRDIDTPKANPVAITGCKVAVLNLDEA